MDLAERVDRAVRRMPPGVRALTASQGDRTVAHHWSPPEPTDLRSLTNGYGIWSCGDGRYFGDGTGGQYLVVDPERELAVTVLSGDSHMDAIQDALAPLVRRAAPAASRPPGDGG